MWRNKVVELSTGFNIDSDMDISKSSNQKLTKAINYLESRLIKWPFKYAFVYDKTSGKKFLLCHDSIKIPETMETITLHKYRVLDIICNIIHGNKFKN